MHLREADLNPGLTVLNVLKISIKYILYYGKKDKPGKSHITVHKFHSPVRYLNSCVIVNLRTHFLLKDGKILQSGFNINKYAPNQALQEIKGVLMTAGGAEYRLLKYLLA